jgi:hypothetical protein
MRLVATTIFICLCSMAQADNAFLAAGPGLATCNRFSKETAKDSQIEKFFFSWAQGWMSAANLMLSVNKSSVTDLNAMSLDGQMLHIRAYCQENPSKYYESAIIDLYDSMRRTQGLPSWITSLQPKNFSSS